MLYGAQHTAHGQQKAPRALHRKTVCAFFSRMGCTIRTKFQHLNSPIVETQPMAFLFANTIVISLMKLGCTHRHDLLLS
jgi:hypothetical protein